MTQRWTGILNLKTVISHILINKFSCQNNIIYVLEIFSDNPDPDEKIMLYLRQNFPPNHNSEILEKMKETVFSRKTIIRRCIDKEDYTDLKQIPEIMPRLFDLQGMVKNNYSNVL